MAFRHREGEIREACLGPAGAGGRWTIDRGQLAMDHRPPKASNISL